MELREALRRVGAEVAKEKTEDKRATYFVRVNVDMGQKWVDAVTSFLLGAKGRDFTVDLSKYFYVAGGEVKYLWRAVIDGNVQAALTLWAQCAVQSHMDHVPEITSFPLVGRIKYPIDLARGKTGRVHDMEEAPAILNMAIGAGVVGSAQ